MESFGLWSLTVWPARGLNNFISADSILRLCEAVKVQFSDPYKNVGKIKVLCNFKMVSVLTFLRVKGWYWPQELLSMPTDNIHKSWVSTV
jgi:hypothetical protein